MKSCAGAPWSITSEQAGRKRISVTPPRVCLTSAISSLAIHALVRRPATRSCGDPGEARKLTARGTLSAGRTNGPPCWVGQSCRSRPSLVIEGKSVLLQEIRRDDCFDIEVNELDPAKLARSSRRFNPFRRNHAGRTSGSGMLQHRTDACSSPMNIPLFARRSTERPASSCAAVIERIALRWQGLAKTKLVFSGGGAAALCLFSICSGAWGMKAENIWVSDIGRESVPGPKRGQDPTRPATARKITGANARRIMPDASVFLGLSAGERSQGGDGGANGRKPLILASPTLEPEILPDCREKRSARAVIARGVGFSEPGD